MQKPGVDEHTNRAQLRIKRDLLFADFLKDPSNTRLALEIKLIDDKIWDTDIHRQSNIARHSSHSNRNVT